MFTSFRMENYMFDWNWEVENQGYLKNTLARCKRQNILLPTFEELKKPGNLSKKLVKALQKVDLQETHPLNLFRINW